MRGRLSAYANVCNIFDLSLHDLEISRDFTPPPPSRDACARFFTVSANVFAHHHTLRGVSRDISHCSDGVRCLAATEEARKRAEGGGTVVSKNGSLCYATRDMGSMILQEVLPEVLSSTCTRTRTVPSKVRRYNVVRVALRVLYVVLPEVLSKVLSYFRTKVLSKARRYSMKVLP